METKHTKGPWVVSNSGGSVQRCGMVHPSIICILEKSPLKISPEVEANAKLIAAAPELLKALQYAVKFIKLCPKITEEEQPQGLEKWERIIQKATE